VTIWPAAVALGLLVTASAAAHWEEPEAIVAELDGSPAVRAFGVVGARRDERAPRLLVIRVAGRWYERPPGARRRKVEEWLDRWRHSVPQGLIAILDAGTGAPVVRFGAGGVVAGLAGPPPSHERGDAPP
jgi:hypothetical protein